MRCLARCFCLFLIAAAAVRLQAQQVTLMGLRAQNHAGAFHGVRSDAAGNLYTLFDAEDGVRLLKLDSTGTQLLGQVQIGQAGDTGIALDVDAGGSVYVAGTSTSSGPSPERRAPRSRTGRMPRPTRSSPGLHHRSRCNG